MRGHRSTHHARQGVVVLCLILVAFHFPTVYSVSSSGTSSPSDAITPTDTVTPSQSNSPSNSATATSAEPSSNSDSPKSTSDDASPSSDLSPSSTTSSPSPSLSSSSASATVTESSDSSTSISPSSSSSSSSSSSDDASPTPTQTSDMSSTFEDISSSMSTSTTTTTTTEVEEQSTSNSEPPPSLTSTLSSVSASPTPVSSSAPSSSSSLSSTPASSSSSSSSSLSTATTESSTMPESSGSTSESASSTSPSIAPSSTQSAGSEVVSTAAPTSMIPTTMTTTTINPTTVQPVYPTLKPDKDFELTFPVGNSNDSAVYCAINCNEDTILQEVKTEFERVLGFLYVRGIGSTSNRRKRDVRFSVMVVFDAQVWASLSEHNRTTLIYQAFEDLGQNTSFLIVEMMKVNDTIIAHFVQLASDVCNFPNACPLGYTCEDTRCYHVCEKRYIDCGPHGKCQATVGTNGTAAATCVCDSDEHYTYTGSRCEDQAERAGGSSSNNDAKVVGGVLGTICAIFLIIIIYLCRRLYCSDGLARRKYQLGGYSNGGYGEHEFAMKTSSSASP